MPSEGQFILVLCICGIGASWQNLAQLPQIMGRDTLKAIQSVKFHISHQMKPYSRVKVSQVIPVLVYLGNWGKLDN